MPVMPSTLGEAIGLSYQRFSDRPALSWQGATTTYAELGQAVSAVAAAYRALGVNKGDRVLCQLPNGPEILTSAMAAWKLGAIHVGADRDLTAVEMRALAGWLRPALVVSDPRSSASLAPGMVPDADRDLSPSVLVLDAAGDVRIGVGYRWSALVAGPGDGGDAAPLALDDPAVILLTSGTTGRPKGVVRHHGQLLTHWTTTATMLEASPTDGHLAQLPLTHGFGFGLAVAALLTGGRLLPVDHFSASETLALIGLEKVTVLNGTPTHFARLLDVHDPSIHDVASLRSGAGSAARFPVPLLRRMFETFDLRFVHTYGCSEGLGWKTVDRNEMLKGSAGKPPPDRVQVVGPNWESLPPGDVGEIVVRKTHAVEYWGQQEAAAPPGDGGWHRMGDRGSIDEAGLLYVLGRAVHRVGRGGLGIDPVEIEAVLAVHPDLMDAAVVGVPHPTLGEVVCACVVPRRGARVELDELRSYLAPSLAQHKLPERLRVIEQVPRTRIGKVDVAGLRSMAVDPGEEDQLA
jgi:acyl-CoA synthetase (AMP-forming)/AMP-acid ligase II